MTSLPSGLASISARLDDSPQVRGAVAFGRMVRGNRMTICENCAGQKHTDMGTTICPQCLGTGIEACSSSSAELKDAIATAIRRHVRLEWHGHDHADINHRSVQAAAEEIAGLVLQAGESFGSAIDRHAALAVSAGYRSADRR